jgi:hypothetical protein
MLFSIKKKLYQLKQKSALQLRLVLRTMKRALFYKDTITLENCFEVPIIINNRNRYTFLKQMVEQLQAFGYKHIFILDNDSKYQPLLKYYQETNAEIIYLNQNMGYKALWLHSTFKKFKDKHYVYSDPDILLQDGCPKAFVFHLYQYLNKYTWKEKAGLALKIDDIPNHYQHKQIAIENEQIFWLKPLEKDVYDAPLDTTLALYKPLAYGNAEECKAIRVAGQLTAKHLTWYLDSANLSDEELFYKNSISDNTSVYSIK